MRESIRLLSTRSAFHLAKRVAERLKLDEPQECVSSFKDGEIRVDIPFNVRGTDAFVLASTHPPGDNLLELLLLIDAVRRSSAERITAAISYFGYARQDRKDRPRVPVSARLIADMIEQAGAHRILTIDLHADQIQGFFHVPVDHIFATPVFKEHFQPVRPTPERYVVVAPDVGGTRRARAVAKKLWDLPIAVADKRRPGPGEAEVVNLIGEVEGKRVLMIDDIIDTGNTVAAAAGALKDAGASEITVAATHGLFSPKAKEVLSDEAIHEVVVTNTIYRETEQLPERTRVLDIAPLFAEAIRRIHEDESISQLFL